MNWIVIMAGGGGTRLWPLSRRRRPKQFLPLLPGEQTLLGATAARLEGLVPVERIVVVTAASQVGEVCRTLPRLPAGNIIVEPEGRNTAPAIGLSTVEVLRRDPEAVIGVLPSDQFVRDEPAFRAVVGAAFAEAEAGRVALIAIRPTHAETGFGYVQTSAPQAAGSARPVLRFVEKPDLATAESYLASGDYAWNAGMFFFRGARMMAEIESKLPALAEILGAIARDPAETAARYPAAPKISIDYAVMEKLPGAGDLVAVEGDFGWNDIGSFAALPEVLPKDASGNVSIGETIAIDAHDNVLITETGGGKLVAAVGVTGLCVIVTEDAVLVLPRDRAQDVRQVVEALEKGRRPTYL